MKILLADDNEGYGKLFSDVLRQNGHEVVYVCNKFKLIDYAKKDVYDLIISDYNMPRGIEGLEALIEIRKFDANVPIILCSEKFEDFPQIHLEVRKAVEEYSNVLVFTKAEVRIHAYSKDIEKLFKA